MSGANRWSAFADGELVALEYRLVPLNVASRALLYPGEQEMLDEVQAEIKRRGVGAWKPDEPLPFTRAWVLALPGVVSVETPEDGVALVTLTFNAPESTRDTIMDRRLNNVTVRFKVADKPHHVSVLVGDVRPAMGPDDFVMPDDARVVGDAPPLPGGLVGYILHSERAGLYYGIGGHGDDSPDVRQVRSQANTQALAERLLVSLAGEWAAKHGA